MTIPDGAMWAIVELMGRRRLGGLVSEEVRFGAALLRIDVPAGDGFVTQWYNAQSSLYGLTPVDEAIAREIAKQNEARPVSPFEVRHLLPAQPARPSYPPPGEPDPYDEADDEDEDDDHE